MACYQTWRTVTGTFSYILTGLVAGSDYRIRLHFVEPTFTSGGSRNTKITINGTDVAASYDPYTAAGGKNIANVQEFTATADSFAKVKIDFTSVSGSSPLCCAVECLTTAAYTFSQLFVRRPQQGSNLLRAIGSTSAQNKMQRYYHLDALGTVQAITGSAQAIETSYRADAWGTVQSGDTDFNGAVYLGGLGYWNEPGLGLDYVRARWLSPSTGSWLSVDPVATEPRYRYAGSGPTWKVDPSGTQESSYYDTLNIHPPGYSYRRALGLPSEPPAGAMARQANPREYSQYITRLVWAQNLARVQALMAWRTARVSARQRIYGGLRQTPETEFLLHANEALTGSPFATGEQYSAFANSPAQQWESTKNTVRRDIEASLRRSLRVTHASLHGIRPTAAMLRADARVRQHAGRFAFAVPPIPGTDESLDWLAGFQFGITDSLVSSLTFPIDILVGIMPVLVKLSHKPNVMNELTAFIRNTYSQYAGEIETASKHDPFTRGKITGRMLVDLIFAVLLGKDIAKGFGGIAKELGVAKPLGMAGDFEKGMKGQPHKTSAEDVRARTKVEVEKDLAEAREAGTQTRPADITRPPNPYIDSLIPRSGSRDTGVSRAWKLEVDLVRIGQGTMTYTAPEIEYILRTGKRPAGIVGHHINSVVPYADWAGDPRNIRFVRGIADNLAEHDMNFRNYTQGELIDRAAILRGGRGQ